MVKGAVPPYNVVSKKDVLERAEMLCKVLLDPVQSVEKALDAAPDGELNL